MFQNRGRPAKRPAFTAFFLFTLACSAHATDTSSWTRAANEHFEVYSDAGPDVARSTLASFEQLRTWFLERTKLTVGDRPPVRVLAFRSGDEYRAYRLNSVSDAHYVGTESQDFIAMPVAGNDAFAVAAHEYAHLMLHSSGLMLPPWLSEGLAEFFSTVHMDPRQTSVGGPLAPRLQTLKRNTWIPLDVICKTPASSPSREDRKWTDMFYAESWALTSMLVLSPEYAERFDALAADPRDIQQVYGKSLDAIGRDLRLWLERGNPVPIVLPVVNAPNSSAPSVAAVSTLAVKALIAEMLLTSGEIGRSEAIYTALRQAIPDNPDVLAGLGTIAFLHGDAAAAGRLWKSALDNGVSDAFLCYRYAALLQGAATDGVTDDDVRVALERAIALQPGFDDARYTLALNLSNSRQFEKSLEQLLAMRSVAPARSFAYWIAVAYAYEELEKRAEAISAASKALAAASTSDEQNRARQITYMAQTDLTVQVVSDENGHTRLATARKPHGAAKWNPFVEPGDQIKTVDGKLDRVDCLQGKAIGLGVSAADGALSLALPEPTHVQVLNAPGHFQCGPQSEAARITVVYASLAVPGSIGIVRGLEFHSK